jgi:hypothetical protein
MALQLVQLSLDLGIAVGDYNAGSTNSYNDIVRLTLEYISILKECVAKGEVNEKDVREYFSMVGQSWAAIEPRTSSKSATSSH